MRLPYLSNCEGLPSRAGGSPVVLGAGLEIIGDQIILLHKAEDGCMGR